MVKLTDTRDQYRTEVKRNVPEHERENMKEQISELTKELRGLRHEMSLLKDIKDKSEVFEERIKKIDKKRIKEVRYR